MLSYYERVREIHKSETGADLSEYTPTEAARLAHVFEDAWGSPLRGIGSLADMLHGLVWSQCLGNANHRTSILFLQVMLSSCGIRLPHYAEENGADERFRVAVNGFSDASHRLLDKQSEFGYSPARLKAEHRELCRSWLGRQLGDQSRVETTIEPQRLKIFFS